MSIESRREARSTIKSKRFVLYTDDYGQREMHPSPGHDFPPADHCARVVMFQNGEVSILSTGGNPRALTASGIRTSPTSGKSMEFFMRMDTCSGLLARMIVPVSGSAEGSLSARAN